MTKSMDDEIKERLENLRTECLIDEERFRLVLQTRRTNLILKQAGCDMTETETDLKVGSVWRCGSGDPATVTQFSAGWVSYTSEGSSDVYHLSEHVFRDRFSREDKMI